MTNNINKEEILLPHTLNVERQVKMENQIAELRLEKKGDDIHESDVVHKTQAEWRGGAAFRISKTQSSSSHKYLGHMILMDN